MWVLIYHWIWPQDEAKSKQKGKCWAEAATIGTRSSRWMMLCAVPHIVFVNYKCRSPLNSARVYLHQFILPHQPISYILSDIYNVSGFYTAAFSPYIYIYIYKLFQHKHLHLQQPPPTYLNTFIHSYQQRHCIRTYPVMILLYVCMYVCVFCWEKSMLNSHTNILLSRHLSYSYIHFNI